MNFLDLFSGIGGFRLGMEWAGHKCVGYVESDKYARQAYQAMHNTEGEWTGNDITEISDDDIRQLRGRVDCITGGFPCQAFSIAGKRGGLQDTRGTLFFEIARFAKQIQPRFLLLENVKGLLSHDKGKTFATIITTLDELGYDAEWQVLNSKNFGVPQNRERVFIVGHLRGAGGQEVFPLGGNDGEALKQFVNDTHKSNFLKDGLYTVKALTEQRTEEAKEIRKKSRQQEGRDWSPRRGKKLVTRNDNLINCLTATQTYEHLLAISPLKVKACLTPGRLKECEHDNCIDASYHKGLDNHGQRTGVLEKQILEHVNRTRPGVEIEITYHKNGDIRPHRTDVKKSGISELQINNTKNCSNTITASHMPKVYSDNNYRIRKLTPKECFRLQGFPDEYFQRAKDAGISDSQLYKLAGNSVTVNVVWGIAKKLNGWEE